MVHVFDSYSITSSMRSNVRGFISVNPFLVGTIVKIQEKTYEVKSSEAFSFRCFTQRKAYALTAGLYTYRAENQILKVSHAVGIENLKVFSIAVMMGLNQNKSSDNVNLYFNHFTEMDLNQIISSKF